jgi:hypothetical protein
VVPDRLVETGERVRLGDGLVFGGIPGTRYVVPDTAYCGPLLEDLDS